MSEPFAMQIMEPGHRYGDRRPLFTWAPTREHRDQAMDNHGQTLERLNERGGVGWTELEGILTGLRYRALRKDRAAAREVCLRLFPQSVA